MSEPRGFLIASLHGWTLNITIDLKKCVGRLLREGVGQRTTGKVKRTPARTPRKVLPMSKAKLAEAAKTVTEPPVATNPKEVYAPTPPVPK